MKVSRSVRPCTLRIRVGKEFLEHECYTIEHTRGRFFPNAGGTADNQFIRPGIQTMYSGVLFMHSPGISHQKRSDHYEQHLQRHHIRTGKRGRYW